MLGVDNSKVVLVAADSNWAVYYREERDRVLSVLGGYNFSIEHIGSTAIKGIVAKPIIDIAIGMPDYSKTEEVITKLETLGYSSRGYYGHGLGTVLELEEKGKRTHCIHLLDMTYARWDDCIYFREKLNKEKDLREKYQLLKIELAEKYSDQRKAYTQEKNKFVEDVLKMRILHKEAN